MTRIMRLRIPVLDGKEWVSVLNGPDPGRVLVVRESGEEVELPIEPREPLEPQISKGLSALTTSAAG